MIIIVNKRTDVLANYKLSVCCVIDIFLKSRRHFPKSTKPLSSLTGFVKNIQIIQRQNSMRVGGSRVYSDYHKIIGNVYVVRFSSLLKCYSYRLSIHCIDNSCTMPPFLFWIGVFGGQSYPSLDIEFFYLQMPLRRELLWVVSDMFENVM